MFYPLFTEISGYAEPIKTTIRKSSWYLNSWNTKKISRRWIEIKFLRVSSLYADWVTVLF